MPGVGERSLVNKCIVWWPIHGRSGDWWAADNKALCLPRGPRRWQVGVASSRSGPVWLPLRQGRWLGPEAGVGGEGCTSARWMSAGLRNT